MIKEEDDDAKKLKDSNRKVIVVEAKIDKEMYEDNSDPDDDDDAPNKSAQNSEGGEGEKGKEQKKGEGAASASDIDNPFLRPVKFPRTPGMLKRKL